MRIESVRRWLDIILLTAVAVAVVVLIHIPVGNLAAATMGDLSLWWVRVIDLIASTGFLLWLGHIGAIRISHLRYGFDYPPTFFAGLVGTVVLAVAAPRSMRLADNHLSVDVSFDACALMALSAVIYAFVRWINSDARPAIRSTVHDDCRLAYHDPFRVEQYRRIFTYELICFVPIS